MDGAKEDYRGALRRIAAILLALALLAERAAGQSRPLRGYVIRLLCEAGAAARELIDPLPVADASTPLAHEIDDSPAAAMRLGAGLRALALALCWLAARRSLRSPFGDEIDPRFQPDRATLRIGLMSSSWPKNFPPFTRPRLRPGVTRDRTRAPPPFMPGRHRRPFARAERQAAAGNAVFAEARQSSRQPVRCRFADA